jgi:hypothetical protein
MIGNTDMHLVTDTLKKESLSVSGVTTICLMQCYTSPSQRVDQAVDYGLWNVVPLFNGCAKLLDMAGTDGKLLAGTETCFQTR